MGKKCAFVENNGLSKTQCTLTYKYILFVIGEKREWMENIINTGQVDSCADSNEYT